jgi:plasmid stabilization system protein ParE
LESFSEVELRFRKPRGFKNYLVIYQVTDDCVFVLRILHGSQDIEAALRH